MVTCPFACALNRLKAANLSGGSPDPFRTQILLVSDLSPRGMFFVNQATEISYSDHNSMVSFPG
jgi:hypothetical protein